MPTKESNSAQRFRPIILSTLFSELELTFVHSTQAIEIFGNVSVKIYGDRPRGTFPSGDKHKRGSQNIAILDLLKAISRKRCKIMGKLIVITIIGSRM